MSRLATQTVTADEFELLVQAHPNPVITAAYGFQFLTVGRREYRSALATRGVTS